MSFPGNRLLRGTRIGAIRKDALLYMLRMVKTCSFTSLTAEIGVERFHSINLRFCRWRITLRDEHFLLLSSPVAACGSSHTRDSATGLLDSPDAPQTCKRFQILAAVCRCLRGAERSAARMPSMNGITGPNRGHSRGLYTRSGGTALASAWRTIRRCTPNLRATAWIPLPPNSCLSPSA